MNQKELSRYIQPTYITWEQIKQNLLSPQNVTINKSFTDESVVFVDILFFANSSATSQILNTDEFLVLLTCSGSSSMSVNEPYSFNLSNNFVAILGSTPGSIFQNSVNFNAVGVDLSFASFLRFKVV